MSSPFTKEQMKFLQTPLENYYKAKKPNRHVANPWMHHQLQAYLDRFPDEPTTTATPDAAAVAEPTNTNITPAPGQPAGSV